MVFLLYYLAKLKLIIIQIVIIFLYLIYFILIYNYFLKGLNGNILTK